MANIGQHKILRGRQDALFQELHEIVECMNGKQEETLGHDGAKAKAGERSFGSFREKLCQEIRFLDDSISAEEVELLLEKEGGKGDV